MSILMGMQRIMVIKSQQPLVVNQWRLINQRTPAQPNFCCLFCYEIHNMSSPFVSCVSIWIMPGTKVWVS